MVMDKLDHVDARVRLRAAESAGELNIQDASPVLIHLLNDEDEEVQFAAVWALSEIGGMDARVTLESLLEQTEDEEAIELIETAIDNLAYSEELQDFNILDLSNEDLENLTGEISKED
jgi:HEAT repeat protein